MKKLILSAFVALAMVATASAQGTSLGGFGSGSINPNAAISDNATIDVLTTVIQQLTVTGDQVLDFGFVTNDGTFDEVQQGQFTISGEAGATVALTHTPPTTLTGGSGTVTFTPGATDSELTLPTGTGATSQTVDISGSITTSADADGLFGGTYDLSVLYTSL